MWWVWLLVFVVFAAIGGTVYGVLTKRSTNSATSSNDGPVVPSVPSGGGGIPSGNNPFGFPESIPKVTQIWASDNGHMAYVNDSGRLKFLFVRDDDTISSYPISLNGTVTSSIDASAILNATELAFFGSTAPVFVEGCFTPTRGSSSSKQYFLLSVGKLESSRYRFARFVIVFQFDRNANQLQWNTFTNQAGYRLTPSWDVKADWGSPYSGSFGNRIKACFDRTVVLSSNSVHVYVNATNRSVSNPGGSVVWFVLDNVLGTFQSVQEIRDGRLIEGYQRTPSNIVSPDGPRTYLNSFGYDFDVNVTDADSKLAVLAISNPGAEDNYTSGSGSSPIFAVGPAPNGYVQLFGRDNNDLWAIQSKATRYVGAYSGANQTYNFGASVTLFSNSLIGISDRSTTLNFTMLERASTTDRLWPDYSTETSPGVPKPETRTTISDLKPSEDLLNMHAPRVIAADQDWVVSVFATTGSQPALGVFTLTKSTSWAWTKKYILPTGAVNSNSAPDVFADSTFCWLSNDRLTTYLLVNDPLNEQAWLYLKSAT